MPFNIAIIGAGPAGLMLARLLQVADVDVKVTVFERDVSPKSRVFQGGTLDLHADTGLAALKKGQLWDEAVKHLRYEGEELSVADKNNTVLFHLTESPQLTEGEYVRPEIDREILKDVLLHSVNPDWIQWNKTLQSVDSGTGLLAFRDGTTAGPFDLVVGADGAWSKVRAVVTEVKPQYSGVCGFESHIADPDTRHPQVAKLVGMGSYFAASDQKNVTVQRLGNKDLKVSAWVMREYSYPEETIAACDGSEDRLKDKILEHFHGWAPEIQQCVRVSTRFRPWPLYELPVGTSWAHKAGYTLIGDAASLMTPFAGEGVNKAMKDSLELAEAIEAASRTGSQLDSAVGQYETSMFPRAKKYQLRTMRNKLGMFSQRGAVDFMVSMVDTVAEEIGKDLHSGWLAWVPFKTIMFCYASFLQILGRWRRSFRNTFSRGG